MSERIDVAALERLDLLVRDDGNGVAVISGDTVVGLLRLLNALPAFLRLVREAAYAARTGDVLALRAALEPFEVAGEQEDEDDGN